MRLGHAAQILTTTACWLTACSIASATLTSERWCGDAMDGAHPATLTVTKTGVYVRLIFDLSALPDGTSVHGAWLSLVKDGGQPQEPIQVFAAGSIDGETVQHDGKRLQLEAPWYRRFEATDAVRRWVDDARTNLGFVVVPFEGFQPEKSHLEILYDGDVKNRPPQVEGLKAIHHDGQTFLTWMECASYRPEPKEITWVRRFSENGDELADGPGDGAYGMPNHAGITLRALRRLQGLGLRDEPSGFQGIKELRRARQVDPVTYRVYCHKERITPANIHDARLLASVEPLSGYDKDVYKIHFKGEYIDQREEPESVIPTYCVARGTALRPGEGLYVHTPKQAGTVYYAVTTVRAGTENLSEISDGNSLATPVTEQPATPQPVLQWIQEDRYHKDPPEYWYRYWAAPPYVNLPSRSFRVAVAVSDNFKGPGPLSIGAISGTFNVRESVNLPKADQVTLLVERQLAWLPALFYNEGKDTLRATTECKVDYFSERYMDFMIKWIMSKHRIDRSQISGGLLYFGLRHPEIFPKMSFGGYTATYDYRWAPGSPAHLGPNGIKTVDGEDAWDMYSVGGYVLKYPGRNIPFLICISGTGKDRGHTSEFGWQDDPRGWAALQKARQPFVASWSGGGNPYGFSRMLSGIRWDTSMPAFSHCSLDNNPGNGDPADGDYYGQINGYLLWDSETVVDEAGRWEMTVFLTENCPRDLCTVDVTPRHCARFKPRPGERFQWTNTSLANGDVIASGMIVADEWGLVTIEKMEVHKGRNRLVVRRE